MPNKIRQHFVPRFYLKNFSIDNRGKAINIYNFPLNRFILLAGLKTQAYREYFYGRDMQVENALSELEGIAAPAIRNIVKSNALGPEILNDRIVLLIFAVFLKFRTLYAAEEMQEIVDKFTKAIILGDSKMKTQINKVRIVPENPAQMALGSAAQCLPIVFDLRYKLIHNQTSIPFITSDNPVIFYNQFLEKKKAFGSHTGLASKGLQILLPLSPLHLLIFYDQDVYKIGSKRNESVVIPNQKDIATLNELQCLNAHESLYYNQAIAQSEIAKYIGAAVNLRRKAKVDLREYIGPPDEKGTHSILHMRHTDIRCQLQLSFLRSLRKAKRYELGTRALHVRNELTYESLMDFLDPARRGSRRMSDFPEFLRRRYSITNSIDR